MLLVHRSRRAADAVRTASLGGELVVASVVLAMLLAAFGDAVDPAWTGEAGLEFALFDFGGELSLFGLHNWHLLQLLAAGGLIAAGIAMFKAAVGRLFRPLHPAPARVIDKVPIELRPKTF
ncbi:MAG: hypothetical protein J0J01_27950 [Reyranella sp.]|uniref:hypothetical protein n=1 Tax=Reyranella sp. TaxID=1929291 RepID=UPI001AD37790|nr:hypothetical protein [Reyranella sp.]MBN9090764.1 hypothetical protein [Reyranella sp.]